MKPKFNLLGKYYDVEDKSYKGSLVDDVFKKCVNCGSSIEYDLNTITYNLGHLSNYHFGRGGNHIWFSSKGDNKRIAILYYKP